jgi:hypothetical protein
MHARTHAATKEQLFHSSITEHAQGLATRVPVNRNATPVRLLRPLAACARTRCRARRRALADMGVESNDGRTHKDSNGGAAARSVVRLGSRGRSVPRGDTSDIPQASVGSCLDPCCPSSQRIHVAAPMSSGSWMPLLRTISARASDVASQTLL